MPSPPPNGRSSTVLWRSCVQSRRLWMRISSSPASLPALDHAVRERSLEKLGENRQHVEDHGRFKSFKPSGNSTTMRLRRRVDLHADRARERNQQAASPPAGRCRRRPPVRDTCPAFAGAPVHHFAADQVGLEILAFGSSGARSADAAPAPRRRAAFGVGDGVDAAELEDQRAGWNQVDSTSTRRPAASAGRRTDNLLAAAR